MSTATNRWKLGLFVVLGHFLGLGALIWLGAQNFERESYEIVTYVDEAVQGLDIGSAVKIRGVPVGGVTTIRLADQDHRHVEITCEIFSDLLDRDLYAGENGSFFSENIRAKITAAGITGAKYVLLDFFDEERDAVAELPFDPPTNYVPSVPSTLKSLEEGIREILDTLPTILTDAVETMDRLKEILVRLDVESMAAEAERIMKTFSDKLEQLDLEQLNETVQVVDGRCEPHHEERGHVGEKASGLECGVAFGAHGRTHCDAQARGGKAPRLRRQRRRCVKRRASSPRRPISPLDAGPW